MPDWQTDDISAEEVEGTERREKRRRWPLLLLLLLFLLLCSATTVMETWIEYTPEIRSFIVRNIECLQCHTELIPRMSDASVHQPFLMEDCVVCHTPHGREYERLDAGGSAVTWRSMRTYIEWLPLRWWGGLFGGAEGAVDVTGGEEGSGGTIREVGEESLLTVPENELCWICHGNLGDEAAMAFQHPPFERGDCTGCHDPHSSQHRVLLVQDERNLCIMCHPVADEMTREQLHPPFEGRYCTNCHNPHASEYQGILADNQRDLCFICHPSVAPLSLKAVQHQPFVQDNCTGCHEPHGAYDEPLLRDEQPVLCYMCHPALEQDFLRLSHHPIDTIELDCGDCHNPHAADYGSLLIAKDNSLCYECHGEAIRALYDTSAHRDTLCVGCHTPHGSDYEPILQQANPDVCVECHDTLEGSNTHPVRPQWWDISAHDGLTCTSTCHKPHGTLNVLMLTWPYPQDGLCLQCHSTVGIEF